VRPGRVADGARGARSNSRMPGDTWWCRTKRSPVICRNAGGGRSRDGAVDQVLGSRHFTLRLRIAAGLCKLSQECADAVCGTATAPHARTEPIYCSAADARVEFRRLRARSRSVDTLAGSAAPWKSHESTLPAGECCFSRALAKQNLYVVREAVHWDWASSPPLYADSPA